MADLCPICGVNPCIDSITHVVDDFVLLVPDPNE